MVRAKVASGQDRGPLRLLIAGLPGAGLERLAATWPAPVFAVRGGSLRFPGSTGLPYVPIGDLEDLKALMVTLGKPIEEREQDLGAPASTLVLDTLDVIAGVVGGDDEVRLLLRALGALPVDVVMLCHARTTDDRLEPDLGIAHEVSAYVDAALLLACRVVTVHYDGMLAERSVRRFLRAWPDPRHPWILDRTGTLAPEVEVTFDGDYGRLMEMIYAPEPLRFRGYVDPASASQSEPVAAKAAAKVPAAAKAPPPAPIQVAAPPPPPPPAPEPAEDDDAESGAAEGDPPCASCGGPLGDTPEVVRDQIDLSRLGRHEPMCRDCRKKHLDAQPKTIPRKARAAKAAAAQAPPPAPAREAPQGGESAAVVPHGEVVGKIDVSDADLKSFLDS